MNDLISRQAAIDALDFEIVYMTAYCDGKNEGNPLAQYNKGLEDGKKAIEALPSAQPEQKWIPCSERLPEKDGRYQVTRYDYVANTEFIDILWYEENLWWNRHSTGDYAVTAWMPMPKPYKEGDTK